MPTKKPHRQHRQPHPRCNFQFSDGRRCRMLRDPRLDLCLFHHRELQQLESAQEIGAELLALGGNFRSPIALNFVLGKLFAHVATGRMHRRQASTLAYIAQLLLQTLDTKRYNLARDYHDYAALIPALDSLYGPSGSEAHPAQPSSESDDLAVDDSAADPNASSDAASDITSDAEPAAQSDNGLDNGNSDDPRSTAARAKAALSFQTFCPRKAVPVPTAHAHQPPEPQARL